MGSSGFTLVDPVFPFFLLFPKDRDTVMWAKGTNRKNPFTKLVQAGNTINCVRGDCGFELRYPFRIVNCLLVDRVH